MGKPKAFYMSNYITATVKDEDLAQQPTSKKSIALIIWLSFFLIYSVMGLFTRTVTISEEFAPAASAAALLGKDWFAVMPSLDSIGQLLQGIFYLPSMLIFSDPIAQYGSYMIISAAIYSLIPLMAFNLTLRFGVNKTWYRVVAASVCGLFPAILGGSRFLVTEPFTAVIGWTLFTILIDGGKEKKKKILLSSVAAGSLCALAYFINSTYISLFAALLIYVIYLHFSGKAKPIGIFAFSGSFLGITVIDYLFTMFFAKGSHMLSGTNIIDKTVMAFHKLCSVPEDFFALLGGRVYYLTVASFGFAVAALAIVFIVTVSYIRKKKRRTDQFYSENIFLFGILLFVTVIIPVLFDSFLSMSTEITAQEELFSAVPVYPVITGLVFLFFIYVMRYGVTYVRLMAMISLIGIGSFSSMLICKDMTESLKSFTTAQSQGIIPLNPGFDTTAAINGDTMIYPVLFIFTAFAALVPIVCCAKEYAHRITTFVTAGLILYSAVFTCVDTSLVYSRKADENILSTAAIGEFIKHTNDGEMPVIAVYGEEKYLAMNMQYFNQSNEVVHVNNISSIPESCYLITDSDVKPKGYAVLIGRVADISVYAYGEQTVLYHEGTAEKEQQS